MNNYKLINNREQYTTYIPYLNNDISFNETTVEKNENIKLGYSIFDVANWFLLYKEKMTHEKLQKICYYSEAWHLTLYGEKLFNDTKFKASESGPVSPELYNFFKNEDFKGFVKVNNLINIKDRDIEEKLSEINNDINLVDLLESVWVTYGDKGPLALEALSCNELPYKNANTRKNKTISEKDIKDYYIGIYRRK